MVATREGLLEGRGAGGAGTLAGTGSGRKAAEAAQSRPHHGPSGDAETEVQDDLRAPEQAESVVEEEPLQPPVVAHVTVGGLAGRGEQQRDEQPVAEEKEQQQQHQLRASRGGEHTGDQDGARGWAQR